MWNKSEKSKPYLQLFQGEGTKFNKANFITKAELKMVKTPPRVEFVFNHRAMEKLRALTKECDIEIGALGIVSRLDQGDKQVYKVYDLFVPEQECSPTVTRMTTDGLVNLLRELEEAWTPILGEEGGWDRAVAIKDHLTYWWHSHVNMGTTPSGQDEREFETQSTNRSFFFMSIGNKRGDLHVNVKMAVEGLPANFAQWEIRDIAWRKEWETMICVKDEVHPLLLKPGESNFRVRMYEDKGAGELLVDPLIEDWAKEQVKQKVKSGFGNLTRWANNERSTVVVPDTLSVKEFYVEEDTDLEDFVVQYFGPKPEVKVVPVTPKITPNVSLPKSSDAHDGKPVTDPLHESPDSLSDPIPTGSSKNKSTPIPVQVYPPMGEQKEWWQFPKWFPAFLCFRKTEGVGCLWIMIYAGFFAWWLVPIAWAFICVPTGLGRVVVAIVKFVFYEFWVTYLPAWSKRFIYWIKGRRSGWTDADEQLLREEKARLKNQPPRTKGKAIELPKTPASQDEKKEKK